MIFPLRKVIDFAMTRSSEIDRAYREFFGSLPFSDLKSEWEELFLEWLIFDFKQENGVSFLVEYTLRNPDGLEEAVINQFRQIAQTNFYSQFEILKVKRGEWFDVENLLTGEVYKVYDKQGSEKVSVGTVPSRIAEVDGKWYFVGANPVFFPVTQTERAKKYLRKMKVKIFSPKETFALLKGHDENPPEMPPNPTKKELKNKRKKLKNEYEKLSVKYGATLSFDELIAAIYEEQRIDILNFWTELEKRGLKAKMYVEHIELFNDFWNYFPHQCLNNLSPVETFWKAGGKA